MCRIKVEHPREIHPQSVLKTISPGGTLRAPIACRLVFLVIRAARCSHIFGSSAQIEEQSNAQCHGNNGSGKESASTLFAAHRAASAGSVVCQERLQLVEDVFRQTGESRSAPLNPRLPAKMRQR